MDDTNQDRATDQPRFFLSDRQALGLLVGYLVFRFIANRIGLAYLPKLLDSAPWAVPLLNNSMLSLIATGTAAADHSSVMMIATGATSVFQSFVAGLFLYWAGFRFGPLLAEKAAQPGSMWASIWNPKQIERATRWIDRRGVYAIFIARGFLEWLLTPMVLVAGSARMRFSKFLASFGVGAVVYAALMLWLGARAGDQWPWLPDRIKAFGEWSFRISIILIVVAVLLSTVAKRFGAPKKEGDVAQGPEDAAEAPVEEAVEEAIVDITTPSQASRVSPPEND